MPTIKEKRRSKSVSPTRASSSSTSTAVPPPPNPKPKRKPATPKPFTVVYNSMGTIGALSPFDPQKDDFEMWEGTFNSFVIANSLDVTKDPDRCRVQLAQAQEAADASTALIRGQPQPSAPTPTDPVHKTSNHRSHQQQQQTPKKWGNKRNNNSQQQQQPNPPNRTGNRNNQNSTFNCSHCGSNQHSGNKCTFKDSTCFKCQKKGHLASVCRSSGTNNKRNNSSANNQVGVNDNRYVDLAHMREIPNEDLEKSINFLASEKMEVLPVTAAKIRHSTARDPVLNKVLQLILFGWPPNLRDEDKAHLQPYFIRRDELTIVEGVIMWVRNKQLEQEKQYNQRAKQREFKQDAVVWVRTFSKGEEKWSLGTISSRSGPVTYIVQVGNRLISRHADQIREAHQRDKGTLATASTSTAFQPPPQDSE
ncbi:unnamed protein product [Orchesella dallaii]|uniref:CCHC-type domain-containing protein n=1 Tax=Orchesella dallaii TaxID=48710 RepID=A0ABP1QVQ2_9HEXA